jgi:CheY-like chemotaxis protein
MAHVQTFEERSLMSALKTTVLLVDDDPAIRNLLSIILTKSGYEVRSAQDGFSALAALRHEIPDILLSDLYMPGMSGFELLSVVRRRFPAITAVAMSSAYSGSSVPPGVVADAFYEKATSPDALLGIIRSVHNDPHGRLSFPGNPVTPIWIERNTDGSEETHILLNCPECMRTFSQSHPKSALVIHETQCHYCLASIAYALVQTSPPAPISRLIDAASNIPPDSNLPLAKSARACIEDAYDSGVRLSVSLCAQIEPTTIFRRGSYLRHQQMED